MMHRMIANHGGGAPFVTMPMALGLPAFLPPLGPDRVGQDRAAGVDVRLDGDAVARKRGKRRTANRAPAPAAIVPQSAASIGQGERFRYWHGASGRRYLFSRVEINELATFDDAVAILIGSEGSGARARIGVVTKDGFRAGAEGGVALDGFECAYVHLLARDAETRAAVLDDLSTAL